jgi:carbohydrate-binding DOMON domain-containing protein
MGMKFAYLIFKQILKFFTTKFRENAMNMSPKNLFYLGRLSIKINIVIEKYWSLATNHLYNCLRQLDFNPWKSSLSFSSQILEGFCQENIQTDLKMRKIIIQVNFYVEGKFRKSQEISRI